MNEHMTRFDLFDSVKLAEAVRLSDTEIAPAGTPGAVVEVLPGGGAYMVELFGGWTTRNAILDAEAEPADPEAFVKTLGVVTVAPHQLRLVIPASETVGPRAHLLSVVDDLPPELQEEVADFAEFLRQKRQSAKTDPA